MRFSTIKTGLFRVFFVPVFLGVALAGPLAAQTVTLGLAGSPLAENGGVATVTATLSEISALDVTVNLAFGGTATLTTDYVLSGTQIVITAGNIDGSITITGQDDAIDEPDETVIVDIDSVVNGTESGTQQVTATITDDDAPPTVSFSGAPYTHAETGTQTVSVALSAASGNTVSVNYATSNGTATAGVDYTTTTGTLTWTPGDTTAKTFDVPILEDTIDEADETVNLTLSTPVNCTITGTNPTTLTITDDDVQTFVTSVDQLNVAEGSTAAFQLRLSNQPTGDVSVTVVRFSGDTDITVQSGANLTFTTLNWNVDQPITLAAAEDVDIANGSAVIRISASGVADKDVTATEQDNDTLQFVTSADTVDVPEGSTAIFQVRLSAQPSATVSATVTRASGDTDITVQLGAALTFTTSNWNVNQPVTLGAAEDVDVANGTATIRIAATGIPNKDITATEADNDTLQFITNVTTVSVPEGSTATFQVRLSAQPSATVAASVFRLGGDTSITVQSGGNLTFTTANWQTYQTVTLAAAEDADTTNGTATMRITATGIPNKDITATELDDDADNGTISLVLDPSLSPAGTLFDAKIEISGNAKTVGIFGLDLVYNAAFFNYKDKETGTLTGNWTITVDSSTVGLLKIRGTGGTTIPVSSTGSLVTIIFQVRCLSHTAPTVSTLRLENYTDGLFDEFLPLPCSSNFIFYPCARLGDVNNDGNVTPGDAQSAFEIYLGRIIPTLCQEMTSDGNCSLSTTPGDAQDIFEHYLGITSLPVCCAQAAAVAARLASSKSFTSVEETEPGALERGVRVSDFPRSIERPRSRRGQAVYQRSLYALDTIGRPGETVNVPVVVSNPRDLRSFSFEVIYPPDMLEYQGFKRTALTMELDYVHSTEEAPGLIHVEAEGQEPISSRGFGGLVTLTFRVREGANLGLPLQVLNPAGDLRDAEVGEGLFVRSDDPGAQLKWISLGNPELEDNSLIKIPVLLSDLFGLKAFGFEVKYGWEKLSFEAIRRPDQGEGFVELRAREIEPGLLRVGGFRMSAELKREPGLLVELVFRKVSSGGEVSLEALVDDLAGATVTRRNLRLD